MSESGALEQRYRRLLGWFPPEHRRIYGDEMVGVLLSSAPEGRERPRAAETLDLIGGGLRTRLRQLRTGEGNSGWSDVLAVFSVVAPLWLFVEVVVWSRVVLGHGNHALWLFPVGVIAALATLAVISVTLVPIAFGPALARRGRRLAVAVAAVPAVAGSLAAIATILIAPERTGLPLGFAVVVVMEALAVRASPGPRHGWQLLKLKGQIAIGAFALILIAAGLVGPALALAGQILFIPLVLVSVRWRISAPLLLLLAIPGYPFFGLLVFNRLFPEEAFSAGLIGIRYVLEAVYLPTLAIVLLLVVVIWLPSRRRHHGSAGA
jgi:hypothetical protein